MIEKIEEFQERKRKYKKELNRNSGKKLQYMKFKKQNKTLDGFNNRLDMPEGKVSRPENKFIEITQSE